MEWRFETKQISDLIPNEKNPRKLSKRQAHELDCSLRKFGLCVPIVLNSDNFIISGHQRLRLLQAQGQKAVDVYVPTEPLTPKEVEELSVRLNKNVGDWDFDLLANEYDVEDLLRWGFEGKEFGLEPEPKPQKYKLSLDCPDEETLVALERDLGPILQRYLGVSLKRSKSRPT